MENAHEENLMFIINTIVRILKKDKDSTDLDAVGLLSGERLEGVPGKVFNTHLNILKVILGPLWVTVFRFKHKININTNMMQA